ncbi:Hypothetical protein A7982_11680 [Minicystis rosea]|nr:Hypothetical protein A7982_11680 [Minicystis rosea]
MRLQHLRFVCSTIALLSACASPSKSSPGEGPITTDLETSWKPTSGWNLGAIAAASTDEEGAVAYAESDTGSPHTVFKLQRLDGAGAVRGPAIELGAVDARVRGRLTLATDGDVYLACWEHDEEKIACATAPVGEGPATAALSVAGVGPSLAYGSGTFALAYTLPGQLAITRVASNGSAVGNTATFDAAMNDDWTSRALLAATKDGFLLAGGEHVRVHTLDSAFSPVEPPLDLDASLWAHAAIATSENDAVISLSKPYGSLLFVVDDGAVTKSQELSGGSKEGLNAVVAGDGSSYAFLSADLDDGLHYGTIVQGELTPSTQTLESARGRYDAGSLALLRMHGEMFLVATPGFQSEVIVARVHRE